MPAYEIALPVGAKNIKIEGTDVTPSFYRYSKDGAIPIVALFGGDEFIGEVLEGQWKKATLSGFDDFVAKLSSGRVELSGSSSDGSERSAYISSSHLAPLLSGVVLTVNLKVPAAVSSGKIVSLRLYLSDREDLGTASDYLRIQIRNNNGTYQYRFDENEGALKDWTTLTNAEANFRLTFSDGQVKLELDDGASGDYTLVGTYTHHLNISKGYIGLMIVSNDTVSHAVSSDFVRVTYPDFTVTYDLDDDAYQGEGEELLKKAWDTSGKGNHGEVHGATWIRDGKVGKALEYDGVGDYVEIPHDSSLHSSEITLVADVKLDHLPTTDEAFIISKQSEYSLVIDETGKFGYLFYWEEGSYTFVAAAGGEVTPGVWTHLAIVYDGSNVIGYQDGEIAFGPTSLNKTIKDSGLRLWIGRRASASNEEPTDGIIDEVRIYNRALSPEEIQTLYNGGEVTNGLVGEWKFDGGNNRGEVIVWDTMGETDESLWQRVLDKDHVFIGDCIIENGLVRFKVELETDDFCQWGFWNGSSWQMYKLAMSEGYKKARDFKIKSLTPESVVVEFKSLFFYATDNVTEVKVKRGEPFVRISLVSGLSNKDMFYSYPSCRFFYGQQSGIIDDTLQTGWQSIYRGSDNLILRLSHTQEFFIAEARMKNKASQKSSPTYGTVVQVGVGEEIHIGVSDFDKYANLFKEAEDATRSTGAEIDTTQTDDSGDSVKLDAQGEYVEYTFIGGTDLPKGRYIAFFRAKDSAQVANDFQIHVYDETVAGGKYLNEENGDVHKTLTASFTYYGIVFDITDDEDGHTIRIRAMKDTTSANSIWVDYFLIVPIGNGESWPQDLAHSAMRGLSQRFNILRRS